MSDSNSNLNWTLRPEGEIRTGVSLFVIADDPPTKDVKPGRMTAWLTSDAADAGFNGPVALELSKASNGKWMKEFTVMLPGDYLVTLGQESRHFHASEQKFMNFSLEFGIFSSVVLLLVGGMILWLLKRKKTM